ncbi:tetratricopeptide repeat protein [Paraflavitalea pollutisoli]|uniref:tetratricopeptide repeat protein n=1 Tax=Paraflavitalea pollutisoli TaxID=3034143 RepID=UPI0023EC716B|nr:tetratricopeptide repeat protein [Paraflavitalea sp. H1-2-19X]
MLSKPIVCILTTLLFIQACRPFAKDKLYALTHQLEDANLPDSQQIALILQADSLAALAGNDSIRVALHTRAGELYLNKSRALQAKKHFQQAVSIATQTRDQQKLAAALNNIGVAWDDLAESDSAIKYYTSATSIYRAKKDSLRLAQGLVNIGILYKNKGDHEQAVAATTEAAAILENTNDKRSLSDAYSSLGNSLKDLNRYELALSYHHKALRLREAIDDSFGIAQSFNNIGNIYRYQKKYPEALQQYAASLAIKEKSGTPKSIANTIDNIAVVYLEQRQYGQARAYFGKALAQRKAANDKEGVITTINRLCQLLIEMNDLKGASELAQQGDSLSQQLDNPKQRIDNISVLTEINRRTGNPQAALAYALLNLQLKDSLFNRDIAQATTQSETRYRALEKEQELAFVNQLKDQQTIEINRQKIFIVALSTLLALLILATILLIRSRNTVNVLFKELAHRVDNNLQILLGVLTLKKYTTKDPDQQAALQTLEERVNAMASIHHILKAPAYNKRVQVDMNLFINDLVTHINNTYAKASIHFTVRTDIDTAPFEGNRAVTIGLLINELLTNLYKHGTPRHNSGEIRVSLKRSDKKYLLTIADDCAPWHPAPGKGNKGMGLFLIQTLSEQLKGKLKTASNDSGTTTTLLF